MKNEKMSYTLEVFYQLDGPLDMELDKSIRAEIPKYIKKQYKTTCKWSYQEFTYDGKYCDYRLIGFDIGKDFNPYEKLEIINNIRNMSDGIVMAQFDEFVND